MNLSNEETILLQSCIDSSIQDLHDIQNYKDHMKERVDDVAEKLEMKPALLNRAIRTAFKSEITKKRAELSDIEDILHVTGYSA